MAKLNEIRTLTQLIRFNETSPYNINSMVFTETINGFTRVKDFIYSRYDTPIMSRTVTITLTDDEYNKYHHRPELLSTKLYNTPLLSSLILYTNNCPAMKFNRRKIKLLPNEAVVSMLQNIIIHENKKKNK